MLTATMAVLAGPAELLALGLGGLAVVVAVGSALVAYGSRKALARLDDRAEGDARR